MSKGGAGKVYFVLYLAVVLELLIIIVERDEAEEHLHQKQKEAMKIVESILSQLQSGSGTEGINTRPQDEITIPPPGVNIKEVLGADIKAFRRYIVEVGVTDVSAERKRKEGETPKEFYDRLKKLHTLANVEELEYAVFYNSNQDPGFAPLFPSEEELAKLKIEFEKLEEGAKVTGPNGEEWVFKGLRKLVIDKSQSMPEFSPNMDMDKLAASPMHPTYPLSQVVQIGPDFGPPNVPADSIFSYSIEESLKASGLTPGATDSEIVKSRFNKRAFVVNFQPPSQAGWYKLRFSSRTNRILGVKGGTTLEEVDEHGSVNIGTVQLKIKDLIKVKKTLLLKLEKFGVPDSYVLNDKGYKEFDEMLDEAAAKASKEIDGVQYVSNIRLYGYIVKLLTPGQSANFDQNRGAIEFNIRVITPKPEVAKPVVTIADEMHRINSGNVNFRFSISPYQSGRNNITGQVFADTDLSTPVANVEFKPVAGVEPPNGQSRDYIGTVTKELMPSTSTNPRNYVVRIKHQLQQNIEQSESKLTLYPAINEANVALVRRNLAAFATYGNDFFFDFVPPSGNKIAPEQFCYYFSTDADKNAQGPVCRTGLKAVKSDKLSLCAGAKVARLRVVWKDPITGEETDVLPEIEQKIAQVAPELNISVKNEDISGDKKLTVTITNLSVTKPIIGCSDDKGDAKIDVAFGSPQISIPDYNIVGAPTFNFNGDNLTITMELEGKPSKDGIVGGILLPVTLFATNPVNGVRSDGATKMLNVQVSKAVQRGRGRR